MKTSINNMTEAYLADFSFRLVTDSENPEARIWEQNLGDGGLDLNDLKHLINQIKNNVLNGKVELSGKIKVIVDE
ncbi:MAG: hypothetical protein GF311_28245 [Candidatus Lokiarchaeota archaeon]|nr:hypothetical protein [Candidatus Lokiarchaeota archaeon]